MPRSVLKVADGGVQLIVPDGKITLKVADGTVRLSVGLPSASRKVDDLAALYVTVDGMAGLTVNQLAEL